MCDIFSFYLLNVSSTRYGVCGSSSRERREEFPNHFSFFSIYRFFVFFSFKGGKGGGFEKKKNKKKKVKLFHLWAGFIDGLLPGWHLAVVIDPRNMAKKKERRKIGDKE